jgi:lysine 2,3-aminomutase
MDLSWKNFRGDEFWREIPIWQGVDYQTFLDHKWQEKNAITTHKKLLKTISGLVDAEFLEDAKMGFQKAPMTTRITPYLLSLMDWEDPFNCPIRKQFLTLASHLKPDHPMMRFDSLNEQDDSPIKGLTHRYEDKVLFLALDTCPVYCRYCTRAYAVGGDTATAEKVSIKASRNRWADMFKYLRENKQIQDVVISGGDAFRLKASQVTEIGEELLKIDHIRRFRFATKGISVMPMKIITDSAWTDAVVKISDKARSQYKEVCIHTHFNHTNEITKITQDAMNLLFSRGVKVRNQSVFQNSVNDTPETMIPLVKKLGYINVQPYYVYVHDLTAGTEDMRTTVKTAMDLEKRVRGTTAGFNTPTFVVDAPGGGGKRDVHSCEWYDIMTGISVWSAPSVKPGKKFLYFDPLHLLPDTQCRDYWQDKEMHKVMIEAALGGRDFC